MKDEGVMESQVYQHESLMTAVRRCRKAVRSKFIYISHLSRLFLEVVLWPETWTIERWHVDGEKQIKFTMLACLIELDPIRSGRKNEQLWILRSLRWESFYCRVINSNKLLPTFGSKSWSIVETMESNELTILNHFESPAWWLRRLSCLRCHSTEETMERQTRSANNDIDS